ncbi:glycoside hydrolase family 3 C-terminal domain-containing protein [Streptomyces sp. NPDC050560]|uniref:glycoside hydrolase family 3 C-terminal domain-containing protein n=1 Tax=Streptomyces sp. NPDC050560 TaxID=3365630 RepID=UPI00379BECCB
MRATRSGSLRRPRRLRRSPGAAVILALALLASACFSLASASAASLGSAAACATTTAAVGKAATASSVQDPAFPASAAFDGDTGTRWSSGAADPQWLQVDLGGPTALCGAELTWEAAYAKAYQIQVSDNGSDWRDVYSTTSGAGGTESLSFDATARYVRLYGTARATEFGYSLWEFSLRTEGGSDDPPPDGGDGDCPWVGSTAPVAERVQQVMSHMTNAQKVSILHGNNNASPYIGNIDGIPSLCIPGIGLQDGPHGVGDGLGGVTQMPSGNLNGATFDEGLMEQYGAAIGEEFAGKGAQVALGPTVNLVRDPRWGRSFESYGEDPYLNGRMGAADIRGIQSAGVMAEVKHLAAYNIEHPDGTVVVDERTLQEMYLPAFQTAAEDGAVAAAMCAYSVVNSVPACQNPDLMNKGLYEQAGFGGFVTSDWGGTHATEDSANAGLTVEMPNGYFFADFLAQAVEKGTVSQATLDTMASRLLTQYFAFGLFDKEPTGDRDATVTTPEHVAVALKGAEEGTVLLKNDGILPLSADTTKSIAVIGVDGGAGVQTIGGGSATVTSSGTVWPITGIENRVKGTDTTVTYNDATDLGSAVDLARGSDVAIVFASDNYGNEEHDSDTLDLPNNQNEMISQVAAANPRTVVVLNNNSAINMPWLDSVAGVFEGFYPGQQIGTAMAELIFGDVNPSGKLPVTFPKSLRDVPANTPARWPGTGGEVDYSEGLDVGYRWYDAQDIAPLYPFGYGLSYTTFGYSDLDVGALSGGTAKVTATVRNTGSRAGTDVAQLYVAAPASDGEPPHQLRGYQRVTLDPGQSKTVTFTLTAKDLAHWDTGSHGWTTTPGSYQILVGDSSRDLPLTGTLQAASGAAAKAAAPAQQGPRGMSSPHGKRVDWSLDGGAATYTASDLPPGIALSDKGRFTGAATRTGTWTVTVTARGGPAGASGSTRSFVWTVT